MTCPAFVSLPYRRIGGVAAALVAVLVISACQSSDSTSTTSAPPVTEDTWAVVDGRAIMREDVERAYRRTRDTSQPLSDEETLTAKLSLLNDLIVQDILIARAAALKIEVPAAELDTAYENGRKNITGEAFQQELKTRGITADDLREGLRRELLAEKVLAQEVGAKVAVTDQEIGNFFSANRAQFNMPEEAYHIAQIVITPVRDAQVANATGDDATTPQAAAAKAQMLMERLKEGASFGDLAYGYSEDAETAARGGDLGFIPVSKLKQLPAPLRDAVLNKKPGDVNVASVGGGHTVVLVVAHEQAGQRELSTPGVRERITETLRARKEQLLRAAYLTAVRTDADIVNYFARRLIEQQGKPPTLAPAAPPAQY